MPNASHCAMLNVNQKSIKFDSPSIDVQLDGDDYLTLYTTDDLPNRVIDRNKSLRARSAMRTNASKKFSQATRRSAARRPRPKNPNHNGNGNGNGNGKPPGQSKRPATSAKPERTAASRWPAEPQPARTPRSRQGPQTGRLKRSCVNAGVVGCRPELVEESQRTTRVVQYENRLSASPVHARRG